MADILPAALDACLAPALDFLMDVEAGAAAVLDADGRTATGETKRSLYVDPPAVTGDRVEGGVGASSPHALYVKTGRQPGTPPPYQAIADWVETKLGFPEGEAPYPLVRAIQAAIGERGTDGTDYFGRPIEALLPFFVDAVVGAVAPAVGAAARARMLDTADGFRILLEVGEA